MASTLLRTSNPIRTAIRSAAAIKPAAGLAATSFVRTKATLPDLPYDYGALEPHISGKIMELHHKMHHQTYVNGLNSAVEQIAEAEAAGDMQKAASMAPLLNFHGGGHLNHTLFWENLRPAGDGTDGMSSALKSQIDTTFGSVEKLQEKMNAVLAAIQGSGWAWLVKEGGGISIVTRANQDPVVGAQKPLLGIDAWEHAYYLQYQNRKAEYFKEIWNVINWKTVSERFGQ